MHVSRDTAHHDGGDDDDDVHEHYTLMMMLMTIGLVARGCFSGSGSFPLPRVARSWRSLHPMAPTTTPLHRIAAAATNRLLSSSSGYEMDS